MHQIGRYKILKRLGGGGFGQVFLGEDPAIGRQVAIKVFKPKDENLIAFATSSDEEGLEILRARFLNEAKILASLENTMHIVNVLEYGELEDGSPYYVMPYLPRSLADELGRDVFDVKALEDLPTDERPGALPMARALEILAQVLAGLAAAHGRGLIHRDIKPSNIMLTEDDDVRIVDFGIAKAPDGQHSTASHLGLGSRNYMAPEQRESAKHVDARADVYSVGRLAYRMLTGRLPVGRFADPEVAVPEIGKAMNDVILAALEEDREKRLEDAGALLQRFEAAKAGVGQSTGESDTGTWVGEGEAAVRDELKPLRAKIAELVDQKGRVGDAERPGLAALASIADLDAADLDKLIVEVVESEKTLKAKQRLFRALEREVNVRGSALTGQQLASYDTAAEAVGWDRTKIKALMDEAVAELKGQSKPGASTATAGDTFTNLKNRLRLPLKPIAAALVALLVLGGIGFAVHDWRQSQIAEAEAERQRQLTEQQEDAAWEEARAADSLEAYEAFVAQWPDGLHRDAARMRIVQLEEQGQHTVVHVQEYLNRLGYRVPEDGEEDERTVESIKAFEADQGLVVTGNADEVLLEALQAEFRRRDSLAWSNATESDTKDAYLAYQEAFPDGQGAGEIDSRIEAALRQRDEDAWERAGSENTVQAYRDYATQFPDGRYSKQVVSRINAREENRTWEKAERTGSVAGYREYVSNYPDGEYVSEAVASINAIEEDMAWDNAKEIGREDALLEFLEEYPDGANAEIARDELSQMRAEKARVAARTERTLAIQQEMVRLGRDIDPDGEVDSRFRELVSLFETAVGDVEGDYASPALLAKLKNTEVWPAKEAGEVFKECPECPEMVVIQGGNFMMGSPESEPERGSWEGPQHRVSVPSFAIGQTEVTFAQWDACFDEGGCSHRPDDSGWGRADRPVMNVSWRDTQEYVAWLSRKTNHTYRLPTEAEWEYAARADTQTRYATGDCITTEEANFDGRRSIPGCSGSGSYRKMTLPVKSFSPNAFGLFDVHGNVKEFVQDCSNPSYVGAPRDGSAWLEGNCGRAGRFLRVGGRITRGGSWYTRGDDQLRVAYRGPGKPWGMRENSIGFRVAR